MNFQILRHLLKFELDDLVVDFVVPPSVTETMLKECQQLGIKKIWMQPGRHSSYLFNNPVGSQSEAAIKFCQENSMGNFGNS
jgi:predicted CoA-binding protein